MISFMKREPRFGRKEAKNFKGLFSGEFYERAYKEIEKLQVACVHLLFTE